MRRTRSILLSAALLGPTVFLAMGAFAQTSPIPSTLNVTKNDLTAVGYKNIAVITPYQNIFAPPNLYFQVDTKGYLTVLVEPITDPSWSYNNGQMQTLNMSDQIQARVSRPGYYIVVTGSDQTRVVALANLLEKKK